MKTTALFAVLLLAGAAYAQEPQDKERTIVVALRRRPAR